MDCTNCQPLLAEYALGQLSERERRGVSAHLASGCPHCAGLLREADETWVLLVDTLPPAIVPNRVAAKIRDRVENRSGDRFRTRSVPSVNGIATLPVFSPEPQESKLSRGHRPLRVPWMLAAIVLLAVTIGVATWLSRPVPDDLNHPSNLRAEQVQSLQREVDRWNQYVNRPRLHLASLHERDRQTAVRGFVVWDRLSREIHFHAFDLQPLTEGQAYRICIIQDGVEPVAIGSLHPRSDGAASVIVNVPDEMGDTFRVGVTEGPENILPDAATEPWLTSEIE